MDDDVHERRGQRAEHRSVACGRERGSICQQHHSIGHQREPHLQLEPTTGRHGEWISHQYFRQGTCQPRSCQGTHQHRSGVLAQPPAQSDVVYGSAIRLHRGRERVRARQQVLDTDFRHTNQGWHLVQSGQRESGIDLPRLRRLHAQCGRWTAREPASRLGERCLPVQHGGAARPNLLHRPRRGRWLRLRHRRRGSELPVGAASRGYRRRVV